MLESVPADDRADLEHQLRTAVLQLDSYHDGLQRVAPMRLGKQNEKIVQALILSTKLRCRRDVKGRAFHHLAASILRCGCGEGFNEVA